jgi:hypothetical protein
MGEVPRDRLFDDSHFWEVPEEAHTPEVHETHANPAFARMEADDSKC